MRLMIEIAAAALLMFCISATSAAFAAGKAGRSADGVSCSFSVPQNASPRRALRRDQASVRRKILRQLLRQPIRVAVGDCEIRRTGICFSFVVARIGAPLRTTGAWRVHDNRDKPSGTN